MGTDAGRAEPGGGEEFNGVRRWGSGVSEQTSAVSGQSVDSHIQTGGPLIPLAQFLRGSHIAGNRDTRALHSDRSSWVGRVT